MIDQKTFVKLPETAKCLHRAMNKARVQTPEWVRNFVRDFPTRELQQWHTVVPVLSGCHLLKIWFRDYIPNHYMYHGGFTDAELVSAGTRDFIREQIQEKQEALHQASQTIDAKDPFQSVIFDTYTALLWAENLIQCMEDGLFVNWVTLETRSEIEI